MAVWQEVHLPDGIYPGYRWPRGERRTLRSRNVPVGARYSATSLTCGDVNPVPSGMIDVRDVAAGVRDLLSAQRLDRALHAVGVVQDRGDHGAAPAGERLAPAGRPSSIILGRPRLPQRAGPSSRATKHADFCSRLLPLRHRAPHQAVLLRRRRTRSPPDAHPWRHRTSHRNWIRQQARNLIMDLGDHAAQFKT